MTPKHQTHGRKTVGTDTTQERALTSESVDVEKSGSGVGRTELGRIDVADAVVGKIAARATTEVPDAGAAAVRVLGRVLPGAGHLGVRGSDLDALPKTTVEVDGSKAFLRMTISVRWPASIRTVTESVREHVTARVHEMTGLDVDEVHLTVADLVTDVAAPPRVK